MRFNNICPLWILSQETCDVGSRQETRDIGSTLPYGLRARICPYVYASMLRLQGTRSIIFCLCARSDHVTNIYWHLMNVYLAFD